MSYKAVQNERQPRNTAQVREDQIEHELEHPLVPSNATVSATHPAFSPGASHRFIASLITVDNSASKNDPDDAGIVHLHCLYILSPTDGWTDGQTDT